MWNQAALLLGEFGQIAVGTFVPILWREQLNTCPFHKVFDGLDFTSCLAPLILIALNFEWIQLDRTGKVQGFLHDVVGISHDNNGTLHTKQSFTEAYG
ncbi:MAG: hypothetical protein WC000_01480 [Dokdonella sp.]